jgi:hypothetical protein
MLEKNVSLNAFLLLPTALLIQVKVFWAVTSCGVVVGWQHGTL